jgi:hypothetical protein
VPSQRTYEVESVRITLLVTCLSPGPVHAEIESIADAGDRVVVMARADYYEPSEALAALGLSEHDLQVG